jgi:hypothetical protein
MIPPKLDDIRQRCAETANTLASIAAQQAFGHALHWMRRIEDELGDIKWRVRQLELPRSTVTREQDLLDALELARLERDEWRDRAEQSANELRRIQDAVGYWFGVA